MTKEATARNSKVRAERHEVRMAKQAAKVVCNKVPRGAARNLRRKPLQLAYAERVARGEV